MEVTKPAKHFVAVHGACHGAWIYYKLQPRIEAAGHQFTPVNLAASGINEKKLDELLSLHDYTLPLLEVLESVPENEKVILIGHSGGGMSAALGMEKYPNKISVAVFLNAIMPDTIHGPSYVLEQYFEKIPAESWLDTQFSTYGSSEEPLTSLLLGPNFMSSKIYQLCSVEDLTLAKTLMRPSSLFMEDLLKANNFSNERYGSVKRVYVTCNEDKAIPVEFQRWMIESIGATEVKEIKGADHMPTFSKPAELCRCLLEIADKYH